MFIAAESERPEGCHLCFGVESFSVGGSVKTPRAEARELKSATHNVVQSN
jgi:hypothetical protein